MESISKSSEEGINLVTNFINENWQEYDDFSGYVNIDYSDLNKTRLREILSEEQNDLCCYCLRNLRNREGELDIGKITLEHIIPRSFQNPLNTKETEELRRYNTVDVLGSNVVLQDIFTSSRVRLTTPPFPHKIAYQNLVVACNGCFNDKVSKFCNGPRKDYYIPPFFYLSNVNEVIVYNKSGLIYYTEDDEEGTYINRLKLNYSLLKQVRRLWYLISISEYTLDDILRANNESQYKEILIIVIEGNLNKVDSDNQLHFFNKDLFWNFMLEYKWFYTYYSQQ